MIIEFGVWAPSEAVCWNTWIAAGICTAPGVFAPDYSGIQTTAATWPGIVTDAEGNAVPGWHCNVRVSGPIVDQFTHGLDQFEADGVTLKSVWQRTWAADIFQLTEQPADPVTGFPAGMRSASGVTYADARDFSTPANVWT